MRFKITITHDFGTVDVTETITMKDCDFPDALAHAQSVASAYQRVTALSIKPLADRKAYMRGYMQRKRAKLIERDASEAFEQARKDFGC